MRIWRTCPRRAHPRSRGENCVPDAAVCEGDGSSPPTRGKPPVQERAGNVDGLIPAHAGKTVSAQPSAWTTWAHPRPRGENQRTRTPTARLWGSSPPTRGKRVRDHLAAIVERLIPAHAGKTLLLFCFVDVRRAHPRPRGENGHGRGEPVDEPGSSPPTRGKRNGPGPDQRAGRLIPAHAGKTRWRRARSPPRKAHPRPRGENHTMHVPDALADGSSPPTRGKLRQDRP